MNAAQRLSFNYTNNDGKAVFVISNAKPDDQAKYTLHAKNRSGAASTSANLIVKIVPTIDDTSYVNPDIFDKFELKKKPKDYQEPSNNSLNARIKITVPLKDAVLVEGTLAIFSCTVDAYPKAEVNKKAFSFLISII